MFVGRSARPDSLKAELQQHRELGACHTGANTNVGTVTTNWHTIAFRVDGLTSETPYFEGVAGTPISATFCGDEALSPILMIRNGAGAAKTLEVDYVKVVQVR